MLVIYDNLRELDIVDRLGHIRALISFARVSQALEDALERWTDVLVWNRFYNPFEEEVFTCGVVYFFICVTFYALGESERSFESFSRAIGVVQKQCRQFLIPGIGTYLYDEVYLQVQSITGWL